LRKVRPCVPAQPGKFRGGKTESESARMHKNKPRHSAGGGEKREKKKELAISKKRQVHLPTQVIREGNQEENETWE